VSVHGSRRYRQVAVTGSGGDAPLEGIRVLDLSRVVSGPLCARILADLGADVVKVEAPGGDVSRLVPPHVQGTSVYFAQLNAGKRNVCLDLKGPHGSEVIARLADRSDVLIENFRPGVLSRAGLGPDQLRARNPGLVYCSITGWGQDGPWRDRQAYAPLVHAEAGLLELAGRLRGRPAEQEVQIHGDTYPALMAATAVTTALFARSRTGSGQHLDISMAETMVYMNEWAAVDMQGYDGPRGPVDIWEHVVVAVADGTEVALVGSPERLFRPWMEALGDQEALADPRFAGTADIAAHRGEAVAALARRVARVPDVATLESLTRSSPMLVAEVRSFADLAASDWARERPLATAIAEDLRVPTAPWHSDRATIGVAGPPATRGEHNREVLVEWAGMDEAEVARLVGEGTLCAP
jgi:crotonobetainyl-CoA:carnitine CoA-transferase CaiB-like acyl-CoA transferase